MFANIIIIIIISKSRESFLDYNFVRAVFDGESHGIVDAIAVSIICSSNRAGAAGRRAEAAAARVLSSFPGGHGLDSTIGPLNGGAHWRGH